MSTQTYYIVQTAPHLFVHKEDIVGYCEGFGAKVDDATMAEAVKIVAGRAKLEASGGITLERLGRIAAIGVDFVSIGALTHSVKAADISLDIEVTK